MTQGSDRSPLLQYRGVALVREGNGLLTGIDLDILPGERLIVLGPNGAGKTLLMHIGHGLIAPTSGRFWSAVITRPTSPTYTCTSMGPFLSGSSTHPATRTDPGPALTTSMDPNGEPLAMSTVRLATSLFGPLSLMA